MSIQSTSQASAQTSGYQGAQAGGNLIAGVASIANSIVTPIAQKRAQERAMKYNKAMMDYQNQLNIQNWQRENSYNTPARQMQRYVQAGLNPNLVAMDGSSGLAGDVGSVTPTSFSGSDFDSGISGALQNFGDTMRNIGNDYYANKLKSYQADRQSMENQRVGATLIQTINDDLLWLQDRIFTYRRHGNQAVIDSVEDTKEMWSRGVSPVNDEYGIARGWEAVDDQNGDDAVKDMIDSKSPFFNYMAKSMQTFRNNVMNNLRSAIYDMMLHDLDRMEIGTKKGYLSMLQDKYKVEENLAEFERGLQNLDLQTIMKHPGIVISKVMTLLFKANSMIQPYYLEHRRSIELNRPRTTEILDPYGVVQSTRYSY